jgi:isocitrate dehydrogenase kinase/phosphatase
MSRESAHTIARIILEGFDRHYTAFRGNSQLAKNKFERGEYSAIRELLSERISFYDHRVKETSLLLEKKYDEKIKQDLFWPEVKKAFIMLLTEHKQPELAESFFNSIATQVLDRNYFQNYKYLFVRPSISTEYLDSVPSSYRVYYPREIGFRSTTKVITKDIDLNCPWENINRDIRALIKKTIQILQNINPTKDFQIHIMRSLFFRNKGAYMIGRIVSDGNPTGFAIPILKNKNGELFLDTIVFEKENLGVLFSFSRAYFMADMEVPAAYVNFLKSIMPSKPTSELYTMLGLQKQGKTLFYRDFLHHLKNSTDKFVLADGIKGLVMLVFNLPSFPYVFKVIKDKRQKDVSREHIRNRYHLVKHHDRVGRLADTWEYSNVDFPIKRFDNDLLEELRRDAPSMFEQVGDHIIIKHVYIERRMIPLNIFIEKMSDRKVESAIVEYGDAIKQLLSVNIFPGDLLYKNFGMTKNGRVVFYDYDEIQYITECVFRSVPPPNNPEDELSEEPWYSIGPNDVFPEEFETFLLSNGKIRKAFLKSHADLLSPSYWKTQQEKIKKGYFEDVFPYSEEERFTPGKLLDD